MNRRPFPFSFLGARFYQSEKRKGAFVSESALHFDGDKPNFVGRRGDRDDHLSRSTCVNRPRTMPAVIDRRDRSRNATIPED